MPVKAMKIKGAMGQKSSKIQQIVMIPVRIGMFEIETQFLIVPNLVRPMILGFNWLRGHEITIALKKDQEKLGIIIEKFGKVQFIPFIQRDEVPEGMQDTETQNLESGKDDFLSSIKMGLPLEKPDLEKLEKVLKKYPNLFSSKLGRANCYEHTIEMNKEEPLMRRSYNIPYAYREKMAEKLKEMEDMGIISRQATPYSSPLTFALKKDGSIRVLLDAREINKYMVAETEAPPLQIDVLNSFHGANFITTIDLNNAYFQIPINKEGKKYTGFTFNGKSYVYNVLPQGLKTSVGSFSRAMDVILGPEVREFCVNYLDDLAIITTGTLDEHLEHVDIVLGKLNDAGLTCNLQKCEFICKEIKMLGFIISTEGIRTDPDKVRAIQEFPVPKKIKQVRAFLGLCNFYRRFIPSYSESTIPLCALLQKGKKWHWGEKEQSAFERIKNEFISTIMLHHPDFHKPYYLQTDCSGIALAGVLYQYDEDQEMKILGYHSKVLKGSELNWTTTEQEFYAVISCLKKFETYLRGNRVIIRTDHRALQFVKSWKLYNSRVTRWILYLEQFDYEVQHIAGRLNVVADVLSRYPPKAEYIQEDKERCPEICYIEYKEDHNLSIRMGKLAKWQREDSEIKEIINRICMDDGDPNDKVGRMASRCCMENDIVYVNMMKTGKVVYMPKALTKDIIKETHLEMGHQGPYKIIKYLKDRMYWKGLNKDVKQFTKSCHICQLAKGNNIRYVGPCKSIVTKDIGELVMADLYGPLPKGAMGYVYILVVQDSFSKFIKLFHLKRATAAAVVAAIKRFTKIIKPKAIMTDNGSQFISALWRSTLNELGIKAIYTTVRNPRPNTTERVNKELGRLFRTFCHEDHRTWVKYVPKIEELYNNTLHESTGYTPCEIMYGESTKLTFDRNFPILSEKLNVDVVRENVRSNLLKASLIRQGKFNRRNRLLKFNIGDLVKLRRLNISDAEQGITKKFELLYEGPYRVAAVPFDNVYTLTDPKTNALRGNFNTYNLSRYYQK